MIHLSMKTNTSRVLWQSLLGLSLLLLGVVAIAGAEPEIQPVTVLETVPPLELRRISQAPPAVVSMASEGSLGVLGAAATSGGMCEDGVVVDDGTVEDGLSFVAAQLDLVMLLDVGRAGARIEEVCICWSLDSSSGPQVDLPYDIVVYDVDESGEPGVLLEATPTTAFAVPEFPDSRFYTCAVTDEDVRSTSELLFVGASWLANSLPEFFLCADLNGPNQAPIFASGDLGATWFDQVALDIQDIRSLFVRVTTDDLFTDGFESGDVSAWSRQIPES